MVLRSQASRSSGGRRRVTSRYRKRRYRRWVLLLLFFIAAGTYWFWPSTETPSADANARETLHTPEQTTTHSVSGIHKTHSSQTSPQHTTTTTASPAQSPATFTAKAKQSTKPSLPKLEKSHTTVASLSTIKSTGPKPTLKPANFNKHASHSAVKQTDLLTHANQLLGNDQWVDARTLLNAQLIDPNQNLSLSEAQAIREKIQEINTTLIFSPRPMPNDPLTELYTIASGDLLAKVAPKYGITYQLIEHINGISARRIRVGQRIKLIHGPFHAVVTKSDYRMDLFLTDPDGEMIYIHSLPVGLGEDDSTPLGSWIVRQGGKVANPGWTNPRTGKVYAPDNPQNPIGEYWIGLEGTDDDTQGLAGYGIHGTIDLESIGKQVSMGCVRLLPDDIALVYKLLANGRSTVVIQP